MASHDEDITPTDTNDTPQDDIQGPITRARARQLNLQVSSFLYLHNNFWYNSLGSTCICLYLIEGTIVFQSASSSKSNIRFVGSPIMLLHPWDCGPSRSMPQGRGEHLRDGSGRPPPWPPP